ncbi:MAG: hypothetical protein NWQ55_12495 [Salibacteraceae bacterium]|jgi:Ca2+/Na+ antiporter|nr:hypothetical protein [Salibacteraceae bacterium]MDP4687992.1 hypothetical protein [Salibacteraceae bacterium]MDP4762118.1 hypothetical protein [Salibacteraceae bacterium]MDP4843697.1 hypothetical protein [Salibacteraceae bacterium]MDP4934384.1 hypothetical protein [Salibacteraceae bacterium]
MQEFRKFIFPGVVTLLGLVALIVGFKTGQNSMYLFGSLALFLAGAISLIAASVQLSTVLKIVLSVVLVALVSGLTVANYLSIKLPIEFNNEKERRYTHVIQRLKDIRTAELAYKTKYQKYAGSFDTLVDFLRNDSLLVIKAEGLVPDTMSLENALAAGIVTRDTSLVNVYDSLFASQDPDSRVHKFVIDSLPMVPFSGGKRFDLQAGFVERSSVKVAVFQATDAAPFDKSDVKQVGSMNDPKTNGNWE